MIEKGSFGRQLITEWKIKSKFTSKIAKIIVSKLTNILNKQTSYSKDTWAECLASLQYLRSNVFSFNSSDDSIIDELTKRKPHLSDKKTNKLALKELKTMFN